MHTNDHRKADTQIKLNGNKPFDEYKEAKTLGIETKPVVIGAFTFLKLAKYSGNKTTNDYVDSVISVYKEIIERFNDLGAEWIQFDEPALVTDLTKEDVSLFETLYKQILSDKGNLKVLLQTYFGDIRDCYNNVVALDFDGIGLDFLEGKKTKELVEKNGFPKDKVLFAGLVNGKNIWKCNYKKTLTLLDELKQYAAQIVLSTSCSLLHVPYALENETNLKEAVKQHFAFALEKLQELKELSALTEYDDYKKQKEYVDNCKTFEQERLFQDEDVKQKVSSLSDKDFIRHPKRSERQELQKKVFDLPILPTTTIIRLHMINRYLLLLKTVSRSRSR